VNASHYRPKRIYSEYPLGLGYVGTALLNAGAQVRVLDLALDATPLSEAISTFKPTTIGFSFLSTSWPSARQEVEKIRDSYDGYIIAGGIHATLFPDQVLQAGFDVVVCGESESTVVDLVKRLGAAPYSKDGAGNLDVPGVAFLHSGILRRNPDARPVTDLDSLPFIDRDIYNLSLYSHHSIMTSRGCPYACKFCCNWGAGPAKCRSRSPANVLGEIRYLVTKYKAHLIYFADDLFFFSAAQRLAFCQTVCESNLDIEWVTQLRVDSVDRELLSAMKSAGCIKVCFGVEAGDQTILDAIGKRVAVEQIRSAITGAHRAGLKTKTWWILGLPGSLSQQMASLDLMLELMPNEISIHSLAPLPGSEYWLHPDKYGIHILDREDYGSLYYHSLPTNLRLDYLSPDDLRRLFDLFIQKLKQAGYRTTDEAPADYEYLLSTPFEEHGFQI
jgi:anaerobic magnesium-protoporphyrin IX monomethyl ester cyclase